MTEASVSEADGTAAAGEAGDATVPAIETDELGFRYRDADGQQLTDVRLRITRGERVAVMGETGAGKTTLAMVLNGLVPHHHEGDFYGTARIDGLDTVDADISALVRRVGLVLQDPESQVTGRLARDDVAVGPANLGLPREEVLARTARALERVGLTDLADRDTGQMSGGQLQRVAIAGILAMEPAIVVLDEPTSELDPAGTRAVFAVVEQLTDDRDRTVVLVEHEPELVAAWADRLVVLQGGEVRHDGPPAAFFDDLDRVEAAGLRAPQVTEVIGRLRAAGVVPAGPPVTTVAGAVEALADHPPTVAPAVTVAARADGPDGSTSPPAAPVDAVVEAVALRHVYPSGVEALAGIDLRISRGEFVALLGRNGAGKTTFARHLNGLLRPTSGRVLVDGSLTDGRDVSDLATSVGYVFQNPDHQIFAPTVRDEVAFGLRNRGWDADASDERVREVLSLVGMERLVDRHPYRLGKGQRQRLAVASVLALEPDVLVIDEPTTGQDRQGARSMMELVRLLNVAGHTILMITHDMPLVAEHADRAVVFVDGAVRADLPVSELFTDATLLDDAHLQAPQVTELARALGAPPVATVPDLLARWGVSA